MSTIYPIIKHAHMTLAIVSITGFILRFIWKQRFAHLLEKKIVRVLPHIIDTFLLLFGIWLTTLVWQYPLSHSWLTAKIGGLIVYILLGTLALKRCTKTPCQYLSFFAAISVFAWIASVAISHQSLGFLAGIFKLFS